MAPRNDKSSDPANSRQDDIILAHAGVQKVVLYPDRHRNAKKLNHQNKSAADLRRAIYKPAAIC